MLLRDFRDSWGNIKIQISICFVAFPRYYLKFSSQKCSFYAKSCEKMREKFWNLVKPMFTKTHKLSQWVNLKSSRWSIILENWFNLVIRPTISLLQLRWSRNCEILFSQAIVVIIFGTFRDFLRIFSITSKIKVCLITTGIPYRFISYIYHVDLRLRLRNFRSLSSFGKSCVSD